MGPPPKDGLHGSLVAWLQCKICALAPPQEGEREQLKHTDSLMIIFQVMEETSTQITWPSKLKIGAKSKKGIFAAAFTFCFLPVHIIN